MMSRLPVRSECPYLFVIRFTIMHLLNTMIVTLIDVIASTALTLNKRIAIEESKDPEEALAYEPITVQPVGIFIEDNLPSFPCATHQILAIYVISIPK